MIKNKNTHYTLSDIYESFKYFKYIFLNFTFKELYNLILKSNFKIF